MHCSVSWCTFCKLWRNFGVSVPSIISTDFLFQSLWFVSGFKALLLVIVRPVSGYIQLVCFKGFSDLSYSCHLQLKQCLPPFLDKNSPHHHDFLRHSQFCLCRPSWASAFKHWDLHLPCPHSNDWQNRITQNPLKVCKVHSAILWIWQ